MCVITAAVAGSAAAATMANVAIGVSMAGTLLSAYGQMQQASAQADAAEFQAKQAEANARAAEEEGRVAEAQKRRQIAQTIGTQRAALAASGADISDPDTSAANILNDTAEWGDYDARLTRYNSDMQAWAYRNQAQGYRADAGNLTTAGAIGAGASLLNGASRVADKWYSYNRKR